MAIADGTARTDWEGNLARGKGSVTPDTGAFEPLEMTWASRTEAPDGKTSPKELLAAAQSSCFAMAFNVVLAEQGTAADRTSVTATVTLDEVDGKPTITTSRISLRAAAPDLDEQKFREVVDQAAALFAGAQITVEANLK